MHRPQRGNDNDVHLREQRRNIPTDTEAYYEAVASQEEIYLEETEEELRVILESDDPLPPRSERPSQHREPAAEELITGDSDDPPLSEEAVEEMLSMTLIKDLHGYGPLSLTKAGQA